MSVSKSMSKDIHDFEQILDSCLARLQAGEPLERCLADYPEQNSELRPLLLTVAALRNAPRTAARPQAVEQGQTLMLAALAATSAGQERKAAVSFGTLRRYAERIQTVLRQEEVSRMRVALRSVATTIVVLFVSGFLGLAVSADSLPGEPFYPLKRVWESARLGLTFDPDARQLWEAQIQQNRQQELAALIELGRQTQVIYEGFVEQVEENQLLVDGFTFEMNRQTRLLLEPEVGEAIRIETEITADGRLVALEISAGSLAKRPTVRQTPSATPCNTPACVPPTSTPTPCNQGACGNPTSTPTPLPTKTPGGPTPTPCNSSNCPTATPTPCNTGACVTATFTPLPTKTPGSPTPTPCNSPACATPIPTPTPCNLGACGGPTATPIPTNPPGDPTPTPCNTPACQPPTATPTPCNTGACGNPTPTPIPTSTAVNPTPTPCNTPTCQPPTATPTPCNAGACGGSTPTPLPTNTPGDPTPTPCNTPACQPPTPSPTVCNFGVCGGPTPTPIPTNPPVEPTPTLCNTVGC